MDRLFRLAGFGLAVLWLLTGLAMIFAPATWYELTPGVDHTGPFNGHFVIDIGLVFAASSAAWFGAVTTEAWRVPLALAGCAWPGLHGAFHIIEWARHGLPASAPILVSEAAGVIAPAAVGVALAVWALRKSLSNQENTYA